MAPCTNARGLIPAPLDARLKRSIACLLTAVEEGVERDRNSCSQRAGGLAVKNVILIALFALAACGGSGTSGGTGTVTKDLSMFTGATWNANLTTTVSCTGQAPVTGIAATTLAYGAGTGGADLQYTSKDGCLFKFVVSGTTASLSNAPVACSTTDPSTGAAVTVSFASYSAMTSDGHNLTISASGTASSGGTSCPLTLTGSGTR